MGDVLYNLLSDGDFHTFLCEPGHTHRVSFIIQLNKLYRLLDRFSRKRRRSGKPKPEPAQADRGNSANLMDLATIITNGFGTAIRGSISKRFSFL